MRDGGAVMRQKAASSATSTLVSPVLSVKKTRPPPERFTARRTGVDTGSGRPGGRAPAGGTDPRAKARKMGTCPTALTHPPKLFLQENTRSVFLPLLRCPSATMRSRQPMSSTRWAPTPSAPSPPCVHAGSTPRNPPPSSPWRRLAPVRAPSSASAPARSCSRRRPQSRPPAR